MPRLLRLLFALTAVAWFALLVRPGFPETSAALGQVNESLPFVVAKGLHAGVYAVLGVGAVLLFRRKWWTLGVVVLHAPLGELGQYLGNEWFATGREGCLRDVLIDWAGTAVGVGAVAIWRAARRPTAVG